MVCRERKGYVGEEGVRYRGEGNKRKIVQGRVGQVVRGRRCVLRVTPSRLLEDVF